MRDFATTAEGILASYAGGHLPALVVRVSADRNALAADLAREMGLSQSRAEAVLDRHWGVPWDGSIFVDLSTKRLEYPKDFDWMAVAVVMLYEEYLTETAEGMAAHLGRCSAGGATDIGARGPWWLWEGVSDYLAYEARFDSRYWTGSDQEAQAIRDSIVSDAYAATEVDLADLEPDTAEASVDSAQLQVAYAGVSMLVEESGRRALFDYFALLGGGECWDEAFEHAFGSTIGDFYLLFEEKRAVATSA